MAKPIYRDSHLHRSMITPEDVVHAAVVIKHVVARNVVLKHCTVAIARRLVVLVVVTIFLQLHLVGGEEVDRRLLIVWIVPFCNSFNQLVLRLDQSDGLAMNVVVIQVCEVGPEPIV